MIFPEQTNTIKHRKNFITFDIETTSSFEFLDSCICFDYPEYEFFSSSKSMLDRIKSKMADSPVITLYGHNAGRFDCIILINQLIEAFTDISILMSGDIVIGWNCFLPTGQRVCFLDSLRLINMSLKKATHLFGVEHKKIDIDVLPDVLKRKDPNLYYEYLRNDVLGLNEVLSTFAFALESKFGEFKNFVTIASCAFSIFKRHLNRKIYTPKTSRLQDFERGSYKGGICYLNRPGYHEDTIVLDVNSLYPSAMLQYTYPISERGYWTKSFPPPGKVGIFKIAVENVPGFPFLYNNSEVVTSGEVYACEETLNYLKKLGVKFRIIMGYIYLESSRIFHYMENLFKLRADPSLNLPIKLIMNSSYGKFAQKKERHFVALATTERIGRLKAENIKFKDHGEFLSWEESVENHEQFVGIASLILLKSRLIIRRYFDEVPTEEIYYTDTDSIHCNSKFLTHFGRHIGDQLGQLKLEFRGKSLYVGKKLYVLYGNENYSEKVRSKGFNKASSRDLEKAYENATEVKTTRFFSLYEGLQNKVGIKETTKLMRKTDDAITHRK